MYRGCGTQPSKLKNQVRTIVPKHSVPRYSEFMTTHPPKITFGEMREMGVRDVLSGNDPRSLYGSLF